jgi:hypothetical protein
MKRRLKRIGPLTAGTTLAIIMGCFGLCLMPAFLVMSIVLAHAPNMPRVFPFFFGFGFALAAPVMYAVIGFLQGVIGAFIYNLVSKVTGGIEVDVE